MTNSLQTTIRRKVVPGLCAALVLAACSTPALPFGATATPRPIAVTLFVTPPAPESPTAEPEPATATIAPTPVPVESPTSALPTSALPTSALPTTAPTVPPTELPSLPIVFTDEPTASPAPTATALPPVATVAPRIITVVVTVTVIATAQPVAATPMLTATTQPTASLRTARTLTPTASAKSVTPTRAPTRPKPTAAPAVTAAPVSFSNRLSVAYVSEIRSDPWGMPYNDDGCTQFDDRRHGRKVYLEIIVHALDASTSSWNAQFYQGGLPFLTCISDPFIQHGTLRERDIPARGYPLPFDISKTLIAFVPEGESVTQLNVIANGKAELCFALSGASVTQIRCAS